MSVSIDLISQFAKVTKTENRKSIESTVYGTIAVDKTDGAKYVQFDGSDLVTPVVTTTNIEDKERVTVLVKDHTATVVGNLSGPSARTQEVEGVKTSIQLLNDSIQMMVTDGNGVSLMEQTSYGWTFNLGTIQNGINANSESIGNLDASVKELSQLNDYVVVTTYNGQPCIELGEANSEFKVRITNTDIQFLEGTTVPAYMSNQKLYIEKAEVTEELQFGGFVWQKRSNGNLGLLWKGE